MKQRAAIRVKKLSGQILERDLVNTLDRILSPYFEIQHDAVFLGQSIPLVARSHLAVQHYTFSKKLVVEKSFLSDILVFWIEDQPPADDWFAERFAWLRNLLRQTVPRQQNHFRSRYVGVVLSPVLPDPPVQRRIRRFHHFRWHRFGFEGMSETFLLAYAWRTDTWCGNRRGREFAPLFTILNRELLKNGKLSEEGSACLDSC